MSWNVRATAVLLYAQYGDKGVTYELTPDGSLSEQFRAVSILEPMVPLDEAVDEVLELIRDVPLSKAARLVLADALGVEPEDVGCAPGRKAKAS